MLKLNFQYKKKCVNFFFLNVLNLILVISNLIKYFTLDITKILLPLQYFEIAIWLVIKFIDLRNSSEGFAHSKTIIKVNNIMKLNHSFWITNKFYRPFGCLHFTLIALNRPYGK